MNYTNVIKTNCAICTNIKHLISSSTRIDGLMYILRPGLAIKLECHAHNLTLSPHLGVTNIKMRNIGFSTFKFLGTILNCIHIFIVTGNFLYWCVMRPVSQCFFIHSCIYLRILIISYLATFLGNNSLYVMCCKAVSQSTFKLWKSALAFFPINNFQLQSCSCTYVWMINNANKFTKSVHMNLYFTKNNYGSTWREKIKIYTSARKYTHTNLNWLILTHSYTWSSCIVVAE